MGADRDDEEPKHEIELPGADAADLAAMLRRAAATGLPQLSDERHRVDLRGGLGAELLAILGRSAIGGRGEAHELGPEELADLRERIRSVLRREGVDPDADLPL